MSERVPRKPWRTPGHMKFCLCTQCRHAFGGWEWARGEQARRDREFAQSLANVDEYQEPTAVALAFQARLRSAVDLYRMALWLPAYAALAQSLGDALLLQWGEG